MKNFEGGNMMFTPDVIEQLNYYVYRLIDPRNGKTFYVGKGKGNRVFDHVKDALKNFDSKKYINKDDDEYSLKIRYIRDIHASGLEVIHVIHRYGLMEKEAFEVEAALIDCYPELTNIQEGRSTERGLNNADILQRNLSLSEFEDQEDYDYCIIKFNNDTLNERGSVYESVRKYWKVNYNKIKKIPYVLASLNGVIIDVFEVERWYKVKDENNRYMFTGKQASEIVRSLFVNKRLPKHYRERGKAYPVLYKKGM